MSEETELIKDRLDIADVVGEYVALKRSGTYFKGLCPFHQEKTPSFIVSPDKGIWHCFGGCSEGGDVFSFIEKIEGIDFPAALKLLAERAGVELAHQRRESTDRRARLFALLELTGLFYHEVLMNQVAGKRAREYLTTRGVTEETRKAFQLGYAPKQWDVLQSYLRAKGYSPQEMVAAGVVGTSKRGTLFDRFRGRVVFPITDVQGRVVAFGGRIAPWHETGDEGKYINSPETELYSKRRVVYNLARAKRFLKHDKACLVVEGYLDVALLDQVGVHGVVATSGTAFTTEHAAQLKRFSHTLHFAFDADAAGVKAAIAATQGALAAGLRVATIMLPEGQDPADVALSSPDKLLEYVGSPQSLVAVLLERLRKSKGGQAQEDYVQALLPLIAAASNPVQLGEMVQEIAHLLAVPESRIVHLLEQTSAPDEAWENRFSPVEQTEQEGASSAVASVEQYLLGLLVSDSSLRVELLPKITADMLLEPDAQALYNILHGLAADTALAQLSADALVERIPQEVASYAEGVRRMSEERLAQSQAAPHAEGQALFVALRRRQLRAQLADLQGRLSRGTGAERMRTLKKFRALTQRLHRIKAQ